MNLPPPDQLRKNMLVALVGDPTTTNEFLKTFLRQMGFNRERIKMINGKDGGKSLMAFLEPLIGKKEATDHKMPDILFLDWDGDVPGIIILKEVYSFAPRDDRIENILFILITGEREKEEIVKAISSGANGFIIRPLTMGQVERKLIEISRNQFANAKKKAKELDELKEKMDLDLKAEEREVLEILNRTHHALGLDPHFKEANKFRTEFSKKNKVLFKKIEARKMKEGDQLSEEGKYGMATGKYLNAAKLDSKNPETQLKLGKLFIKATDYGRAIESLNKILEMVPDHAVAMGLLGEAQLKLGKDTNNTDLYDEAIETLGQAASIQEKYSDRANSLRDLGNAFSAKGETEKAVESYKESLGLVGDQISTLINFAVALRANGQEGDAQEALAMASDLTPTDPEELVEMGKVWLEKEDEKKAFQYFDKALNHASTSKEDIELYENVIKALLEFGLAREAAPLVEEVSKDRPDLYNSLGMAYVRPHVKGATKQEAVGEDFLKAVEAYTKCMELDVTGDRYAYLHNRGMAYYKAEMTEKAEKDFIEAYNLYPNPATENMLNVMGFDLTGL